MNVFIIAALSLDGFLAPASNELANSLTWTSKEDKQFFRDRTKEAGVMVMGSRTFDTIGRALPGRTMYVVTSDTTRSSDDPQLRFTQLSPTQLVEQLSNEGQKELAVCGGASIYSQFMQAGLVNRFYITIEPIVFGRGVSLFTEPMAQRLKLIRSVPWESGGVLLEYELAHSEENPVL